MLRTFTKTVSIVTYFVATFTRLHDRQQGGLERLSVHLELPGELSVDAVILLQQGLMREESPAIR